jgi:hypothetical protein
MPKNIKIKRQLTLGAYDEYTPETVVEQISDLSWTASNLLKIDLPTTDPKYLFVNRPAWVASTLQEYNNADLSKRLTLEGGQYTTESGIIADYPPASYKDFVAFVEANGTYVKSSQLNIYQTPVEVRQQIGAAAVGHQHKISDVNVSETASNNYNGQTLVEALNSKVSLDEFGQILPELLPDVVTGSMRFRSNISLAGNSTLLDDIYNVYLDQSISLVDYNEFGSGQYLIVTADGTIGEVKSVFTTSPKSIFVKDESFLANPFINQGDWIVLNRVDGPEWRSITQAEFSAASAGNTLAPINQDTTPEQAYPAVNNIGKYVQRNIFEGTYSSAITCPGSTIAIDSPILAGSSCSFSDGIVVKDSNNVCYTCNSSVVDVQYFAVVDYIFIFSKIDNAYHDAAQNLTGIVTIANEDGRPKTRFELSNVVNASRMIDEKFLKDFLKDIWLENFYDNVTFTLESSIRYATSNPTSSTSGSVNDLLINITSGQVFKCTAATPPTSYTWVSQGTVSGFSENALGLSADQLYTFFQVGVGRRTYKTNSGGISGTLEELTVLENDLIFELV